MFVRVRHPLGGVVELPAFGDSALTPASVLSVGRSR